MFDFINAVVLGVVEGITEFLPISSTGHLILANQWFGFADKAFQNMFDIVIQLGAILSVVIFFRKKIFPVYQAQTLDDKKGIYQLWLKALIGFLPAAVIGLLFNKLIDHYLMNQWSVAVVLIGWGIVIIAVEFLPKQEKYSSIASLTIPVVLIIGFVQCLALVPGTSRSAATICGAMLLGSSRLVAAEFSFFLAIPTLGAASLYKLYDFWKTTGGHIATQEWISLGIGFAVSFFVAWAVIAVFMKFISKHDFKPFGIYRIVVGVAVLLYFSLSGAALTQG